MKVKCYDLIEGCIVAQDVYSKTPYPIVQKKTVISTELIGLLQAFLVEEITVEKTLANGDPFSVMDIEGEIDGNNENSTFYKKYMLTVFQFKNMFQSWQAGALVDITKVREQLIPLLIDFTKNHRELTRLHRYENKDDYIFHHSISTGLISGLLALKMDYPPGEAAQISLAGFLADCGMAKISQQILKVPFQLANVDQEEVQKHPLHSYRMLKSVPSLREAVKIAVLQHHERIDGTGYPLKVKSHMIHKYARIIAVADVFHAMSSSRAHQSKISPFKVLETMSEDSFGKFDIEIIQFLIDTVANYSIGSIVKLNDGTVGSVMYVDSKTPLRPVVKVNNSDVMLDLRNNRSSWIEEILKL